MKKSIILIICLLSTINITSASFWSPSSLDLYKNIDKWINELNDKIRWLALTGWPRRTTINKEVNNIAITEWKEPCLSSSNIISQEKFDNIILNNSIGDLAWYIDQKCKSEDWKITTETLSSTLKLLQKHDTNTKKVSNKKTDQIYKISNIWLYSDWILENSWFDLMSDIIDINKVIFKNDVDYEWWDAVDIDWTIAACIARSADNSSSSDNNNEESEIDYTPSNNENSFIPNNDSNTTNVISNNENQDTDNYEDSLIETYNNYICPDETNDSWLSDNEVDSIVDGIQNEVYNWWSTYNLTPTTWSSDSNWIPDLIWNWVEWNTDNIATSKWISCLNVDLEWEYEKVVDNSEWPCDDFFCIDVEFVTYQHNLFWWWENITIEYLLNRSNEHLSKYASTSLIQAKMSKNDFEISLENFKLPDMFHLSVQVTTKPIPILNIEPEWNKDESSISAKNMLEEYYKQNGMDYSRRNDLDLVTHMEQEKQSTLNSHILSNVNPIKKIWEYEEDFLLKGSKKIEHINKSIEKKVSYWIIQSFELEYTEVDKITVSINEHIKNIYSILKEMDKIPVAK